MAEPQIMRCPWCDYFICRCPDDLTNEIKRLRADNLQLATLLLSQKVFVHETIITEVDQITKKYIGDTNEQ